MMKKISFGAVAAFILAIGHLAQAQQPTKTPRIGYIATAFPSSTPARIPAGAPRSWVRGGEKHCH
jgi:hypothetical protein